MKLHLLFVLLFLIAVAKAEDVPASKSPKTQELTASPFAQTSLIFPNNPSHAFTPGEIVEAVLGFSNIGERMFNITTITASLRYLQDWRYAVQNFTKIVYGTAVLPGEESSFLYVFRPDPLIEPRDFGLTMTVFYSDSTGQNFTSVFFNSTVSLVEPDESFDTQTLFTYVGVIAVVGLIGFLILKATGVLDKKGGKRRRNTGDTGSMSAGDANEWLEGTAATNFGKSKNTGNRSPKAPKKKSS